MNEIPSTPSIRLPPQIEEAIELMPSISPVANKLTQMAHDIEVAPKDLVKVIMLDPVLTAKVIKLVNSSFYGFSSPIQSLAQAVLLLGVNTVKNLAMCTALLEKMVFNKKGSPLDPNAFWQHSLATAVGCKMLAHLRGVEQKDLELYFLAGLLHDLGKILYIRAAADIYRKIIDESQALGISITFAEMAHFGFTHAQIGGLLARKWKPNFYLIEVIELHHHPEVANPKNPLVRYVSIANNLCKQNKFGQSGNPVIEEQSLDLARGLGIEPQALRPLIEQLPRELEKAVNFLKITRSV